MSKSKEMAGLVTGLTALLCVACFFVLGFTLGIWHIAWLVFLLIPVTSIIANLTAKKKDVAGAVTGLVALLCVVAYALIGFKYGLWHPGWLVFLLIPITGIIFDLIKGKPDSVVGLAAILAAIVFFVLGFTLGAWHIAWLVFLLIPITAIVRNMVRVARQSGDEPDDIPE